MGFAQQEPTWVYEDNNACIKWGNNVIGDSKPAKHIGIRKNFAHEAIQDASLQCLCCEPSG